MIWSYLLIGEKVLEVAPIILLKNMLHIVDFILHIEQMWLSWIVFKSHRPFMMHLKIQHGKRQWMKRLEIFRAMESGLLQGYHMERIQLVANGFSQLSTNPIEVWKDLNLEMFTIKISFNWSPIFIYPMDTNHCIFSQIKWQYTTMKWQEAIMLYLSKSSLNFKLLAYVVLGENNLLFVSHNDPYTKTEIEYFTHQNK